MRYILLSLFCIFCLPALAGGKFTASMAGNWQGVGTQTDGANWAIEAAIGPEGGQVDYPSAFCGGEWRIRMQDATRAMFVENLRYGQEVCIDLGVVILALYGKNRILYRWYDQDSDLRAIAVLSRTGGPVASYTSLLERSAQALASGLLDDPEAGSFLHKWMGW